MKKSLGCLLSATRSLGALLSLLALFIAAFASDSGAQDPAGARLSALIIWTPVVYVVCLVASSVLIIAKLEKIALALSVVPILYFGFAFVMAG